MMKIKKTIGIILALLMLASASGCSGKLSGSGGTQPSGVDIEAGTFSGDSGQWSAKGATTVTFSGREAAISGSGCKAEDGLLTITEKGTYVLSGSFDGCVAVDADKCDVRLVLSGADIRCADGPAISILGSKTTYITLADGTVNSVSDASAYTSEDEAADAPDAAIYSKSDLVFGGNGALNISANCNDAIRSTDTLEFNGGSYTVSSVDDGISGKDCVMISGGSFTVSAAGDGIKATRSGSGDKEPGFVRITGGAFDITAGCDGIQAAGTMGIEGGSFAVITGGGSDARLSDSQTAKAFKSSGNMRITGGAFTVDSADDAFHSNADAEITDGQFAISTGDDGFHADSSLLVGGGTIDIQRCYEGLEGNTVTVSGGNITLTADDDGLNAAGGKDGSGTGSFPGGDIFAADDSCSIDITGGTLIISASGDGIDSNGALNISGGVTIVHGPTNDGNGALDYDGKCTVTGGILAASGSSGMAQGVSSTSTQGALKLTFSGTAPGGSLVSVLASDGSLVAAFAPEKDFSSIVLSTPEIKDGSSYTVLGGGGCSGTAVRGLYLSGEVSGAATLGTAEPSVDANGMGGPGGPGGGGMPGGPGGGGMPGGPGGGGMPGGPGGKPDAMHG